MTHPQVTLFNRGIDATFRTRGIPPQEQFAEKLNDPSLGVNEHAFVRQCFNAYWSAAQDNPAVQALIRSAEHKAEQLARRGETSDYVAILSAQEAPLAANDAALALNQAIIVVKAAGLHHPSHTGPHLA